MHWTKVKVLGPPHVHFKTASTQNSNNSVSSHKKFDNTLSHSFPKTQTILPLWHVKDRECYTHSC